MFVPGSNPLRDTTCKSPSIMFVPSSFPRSYAASFSLDPSFSSNLKLARYRSPSRFSPNFFSLFSPSCPSCLSRHAHAHAHTSRFALSVPVPAACYLASALLIPIVRSSAVHRYTESGKKEKRTRASLIFSDKNEESATPMTYYNHPSTRSPFAINQR